MTEHTGYVEEYFYTDIDIDFSTWTDERRLKLIKAIVDGEKFTFEEIRVLFSDEVTIDDS